MVTRIDGKTGPMMAAPQPQPADVSQANRFSLERPSRASTSSMADPKPQIAQSLHQLMSSMEAQRKEIDRAIHSAMGGRTFTPSELLLLQAKVYTYSQDMEMISRMVDRTVSSVKTTLNTQL